MKHSGLRKRSETMRKFFAAFLVAYLFMCQMSSATADCIDDLCGRWVGQTTVANNEDPLLPFVEVEMIIHITDVQMPSVDGRLFVGNVQFLGMSGPPTPFDLTGIFFGRLMKASTVGTVVSAKVSRDGATMRGYYLDTLLISNTRAHPQSGKFLLMKEIP
jgi:hypothetical protein